MKLVDICGVVFFFKQKTAYEMRISDWSSDVCSSDLGLGVRGGGQNQGEQRQGDEDRAHAKLRWGWCPPSQLLGHGTALAAQVCDRRLDPARARLGLFRAFDRLGGLALTRSEERTSELQSLMRISYAVFCLKKKTN